MSGISPSFEPGDRVTVIPDVAITGGRFVASSGKNADGQLKVALPSAGGVVFGVAGHSSLAALPATVLRGVTLLIDVETAAAVTSQALLKVDATGCVVPQAGTGVVVGKALADADSGARVTVDRQQLA